MKARVSQLHKTEAEWQKFETLIPLPGEIIVFDPDANCNYSRIKIGDGKNTLKELPFLINSAVSDYLEQQKFNDVIDAGRVKDYIK